MLELEKLAANRSDSSSNYYLLLGNGYYNTTYYGSDWNARVYYRPSYMWEDEMYYDRSTRDNSQFDPKDYFKFVSMHDLVYRDVSKPMECFTKAFELAKDDETKAQCLFMIAKCELIKYYTSKDYKLYNDEYFYDRVTDSKSNDEGGEYETAQRENPLYQNRDLYLKYKTGFARLKKEYSKTKFFIEAIENCSYFSYFCDKF